MCGILGTINFLPNHNNIKSLLFHRGPDEQTQYFDKNLYFFHYRLSIIDAEGGKQPMHFGDRYTIIFNGEIYNHLELRKKFNLDCKTNSDTETLLHLYNKIGIGFLNELDGMFAIAIYDKFKRELILIRDRAGKKPLYYFAQNNKFAFASELNWKWILFNN